MQLKVSPASIKEMYLFGRQLKGIETELGSALSRKSRKAAIAVAADARRRAPFKTGALRNSIKPGINVRGQAVVRVTDESARINESGGRHPLFGNADIWFSQKARPFLSPAANAYEDQFMRDCAEALDETAAKEAGFRG